jgi:tetratricopeptide (TPR) repeat protein
MFKSIITLLTLILAFLLYGCSEKKDSVEKYPGFTKIKDMNTSEKFFVDLRSLEQKDDILSFVLLKELEGGGYIIRTIFTDCNETYLNESGTQYKKDGTLFKNIPADDKLQKIANNSEMETIIHYVSQAAQANHIFEKGRVSKIMAQSGDNNHIKYIDKSASITSERPNGQNDGQPLTPQANHISETSNGQNDGQPLTPQANHISETPNGQNDGQPLTPQANHIFKKGRVSKIMTQSGDNNRTDNKLREPKNKYIDKSAVIRSETPNGQNSGQLLTPQANHIFEKGHVLFKEGKYHEALVALKESILIDPNRAWAHYLLAWSYVKLDRDQKAIDSFNNAIRLNPKYALAYAGLGWTYNEMGKYNESVVACKTAIKIMPNFTDAHYNFAIAYNEIGNKSLAMEEYRTVIMLDSNKGVNLYSKIMAKSGGNNCIDNNLGGPNQGTWTHSENKQIM